jgi:hypothetical protein
VNPTLRRRIDQVRRRWWVVLVITVLAVLSVALPLTKPPTYTAQSTLVLSTGRPEQDAAMATGYALLFNDPTSISRLRREHGIPDDVTFDAKTVGASPILTIEVTATDSNGAQDIATTLAYALRDDTNSVRKANYDRSIQESERQLDQLLSAPGPAGVTNPMAPVVQQRLDALRDGSASQLQILQLKAGVIKTAPHLAFEILSRVVGGGLLGILAALGMAALSTRLRTPADLMDKTGIDPLVELPAGGTIERNRVREDRLRALSNIVDLQDLPKSTVVALTDTRGARGARDLAEQLARLSAQQGKRTVLVYADNDASRHPVFAGFNDVLADSSLVDTVLADGAVESLWVMYPGSVVDDRYSLASRDKVAAVLDELRADADTIVVVAPSIADHIESQPICATADLVIAVVDKRSSRARDVTTAVDALADAHAVLLGAVLVDGTGHPR